MARKGLKTMAKKLWGGRFEGKTHALTEKFTSSIAVDKRLYRHDIVGSIAHAKMLAKQRIITKQDAAKIVRGLEKIRAEIDAGKFRFTDRLEDIHMHIEHRLTQLAGPAGGRLHTARSRNDQVATTARLYLREAVVDLRNAVHGIQKRLTALAKKNIRTIMPGHTHLQLAQPTTAAHRLLAYVEMFDRDAGRLESLFHRINVLPLGSGAGFGTNHKIDRAYVAKLLGFDSVSLNTIDSVSSRDDMIEFAACASILMVNLSRLAEELVIWSSTEFGYIDLPDKFCTGSSIMPQKKNPDIPELVRGKTGRVVGALVGLITLMKSLPLAYNRDMQEDKPLLFDAVDTTLDSARIMAAIIPGITFRNKRLADMAGLGYMTAVDLADYLVRKGVPFRESHEIVGKIVKSGISAGLQLDKIPLKSLKTFSPKIGPDVYRYIDPAGSADRKRVPGGPAFAETAKVIAGYEKKLARVK